MKRCIPILLTLVTVSGSLLAPAPAGAQKGAGVAVKQDGDTVVLIPEEPGTAFLVFGIPRDEQRKQDAAGSSSPLPYLTGEQRIATKEFSQIIVVEVGAISIVEPSAKSGGLPDVTLAPGLASNPCIFATCDKPLPPFSPSPPPPELLAVLAHPFEP